MKITILSTNYGTNIGGAEVSTKLFVDELLKKGLDISIVTGNYTIEQQNGVKIFKIPFLKYFPKSFLVFDLWIIDLIIYLQIKNILMITKPDILHIQDFDLSYSAIKAAKALEIKTLITVRDHRFLCTLPLFDKHGDPVTNYSKSDYIAKLRQLSIQRYNIDISYIIYHFIKNKHFKFRYVLKNVDIVVPVSLYMGVLVKRIDISEQKIKPIYNLAPPLQLTFKDSDIKNAFKSSNVIKPNNFIIFALGRLEEYKGFQVLIRSFVSLYKNEKNIAKCRSSPFSSLYLKIAGDGTYANELKKLVNKLRLSNRIIFLGRLPIDRIYKEYFKSDIVILPSLWSEPLSRVVWESFSAGKPLIATSVGGTSEIVKNLKTGILVKPNLPNDLAKAIMGLANNKKLQNTITANARKYIMRHNKIQIKKYLELYKSMCQR